MGGLKKKIAIEKIEKKENRAVAFSKRRKGLYSKSAQFCQRSDDQLAILVAPVSSESNVSFYSFGHSSVDAVVNAFLANQCPPPHRDEKLGFWWDDERVANSDNPDELSEAVDSITEMLQDLKELGKQGDCEDLKKKNKNKIKKKGFSQGIQQNQPVNPEASSANQTLTHEPCSAILQDDINLGFEGIYNNNNEDGILTSYANGGTQQNQTLTQELCSAILQDEPSSTRELEDLESLGTFAGCNQEFDFEDFDFVTNSESLAIPDNNNDDVLLENVGGCDQELNSYFDFDHFGEDGVL